MAARLQGYLRQLKAGKHIPQNLKLTGLKRSMIRNARKP